MPAPPIPQPLCDGVLDEAINEALNGSDSRDVQELDLSFRRIAKIENLVCLESLVVLKLSNNRVSSLPTYRRFPDTLYKVI
jgi:hypothetical protein